MWDSFTLFASRSLVPALLVLAALLASVLLSFFVPRLLELTKETRLSLQTLRQRVRSDANGLVAAREQAFWIARRSEPRRPLVAELKLLNGNLSSLGQKGLQRLRALDASVAKHITALAGLGFRAPDAGSYDLNELRTAARHRVHTRALLFGLIGVAVAIGAINSLLLNEFFQGVLPSVFLFPNLFPDFQLSHLVAVLVFVAEVAIGFVLHMMYREEDDVSRTKRFFALGVWMALVGMLALETGAYALLSGLVRLPERLGLDPTSPFFSLARYFLAFFGLGISLLLAGLGYLIGREYERQKAAREEAEALDVLKGYADAAQSVDARVGQVKNDLQSLKDAAREMPKSVVASFKEAIGSSKDAETVMAVVQQHLEKLDDVNERDRITMVRTQGQAIRDLAVLSAIFGGLVLAILSTSTYLAGFLGGRGVSAVGASTVGIVVPTFLASLGYLCRHYYAGGRYSSLSDTVSLSSGGGSVILALCVLGIVAGMVLLSSIASDLQLLGASPVANIFFGVFLSTGLALLGSVADIALMSFLQVVYVGLLWTVRALAVVAWLALWIVDSVLATASFVVRLLAIPGDVLRRKSYATSS